MKNLVLLPVFLICLSEISYSQVVRGKITDIETNTIIEGATVLLDSSRQAITDEKGNYRFENVAVGRHVVKVFLMGYKVQVAPEVVVNSGKETILNIGLEPSVVKMKEVVVSGLGGGKEASNELALISARSFSPEEAARYAGSRSDPARMASNFAGVQGADDSRNDLVIRGNSPMGVLWRVEEVDITNPNHFASPGTTGGAVSVLNEKVFGRSDFFTAAFPAEYGNATAGVFDVHFRNGNSEKHEFSGQFGFLGTEVLAEGPLSKEKGSSYLISYRYSTLKLFDALNIKIGTEAVPAYQDGSFKINLPLKNAGHLSVFGIGGKSSIDILVSTQDSPDDVEIYGLKDRDQYFRTSLGMAGVSWSKNYSEKIFSKLVVAGYYCNANSHHDLVVRDSAFQIAAITPKLGYRFITVRPSLAYTVTNRFSNAFLMKAGLRADVPFFDLKDSIFYESVQVWDRRTDFKGNTILVQPFVQFKYRFTDEMNVTAGLHSQWHQVSSSLSLEPRAAFKYRNFSLGYGLHSQTQTYYGYYQQQKNMQGQYVLINDKIGFTKSHHMVGGYTFRKLEGWNTKAEVYYQYLFDIPVERRQSSYSMINQGSIFNRLYPDSLKNEGTARNYGVEITIEKFFSKTFFLLATASVFDSKYVGSDGVERNTDFNGRFATNVLTGKEFAFGSKKNRFLSTGIKVTWAGGRRFTPADAFASAQRQELVVYDHLRNSKQFRNYFRTDMKLGLKLNAAKTTHEIGLDLVNVFNTKNVLDQVYAPDPTKVDDNPLKEEYQLGFLPIFFYKIDF